MSATIWNDGTYVSPPPSPTSVIASAEFAALGVSPDVLDLLPLTQSSGRASALNSPRLTHMRELNAAEAFTTSWPLALDDSIPFLDLGPRLF